MKEELFTHAFGLSAPWRVAQVDFRPGEGVIRCEIENTAKRLPCPVCGAANQPLHDRMERSWRHLNFFEYKAMLHARVPRVACRECGKTALVRVPWARPEHGFTQTLEPFIVALCASVVSVR